VERHDPWPEAVRKWLVEAADRNPYATAETLRAWDAVIRNAIADALEQAASRWRAWYGEAARAMPAPSRDHPFPDAAALARVRALKAQADRCSDTAAFVRALEMPAHDRVFNRLRNDDALLEALLDYDAALAGVCQDLLALAAPGPLSDADARATRLEQVLDRVRTVLDARQQALIPRMPGP
jgi:hypothetical protein